MFDAVLDALAVQPDGIYVDGTYGRGGHALGILDKLGPAGFLLLLDKDPDAIAVAREMFANEARAIVEHGSFTQLSHLCHRYGWSGKVNGLLLDLGVSSPQLDDPARGFSFRREGPLDMRMNSVAGVSAAQWLNNASVAEITDVLRRYGEEPFAKKIAYAIEAARQVSPLATTQQLATLVAAAKVRRQPGKDPATQTFQAIRIFINRELEDLEDVLKQSLDVLAPGGRLVVISFHSLEDRIVKRFIRQHARGDDFPVDLPIRSQDLKPKLRAVGKAVYPDEQEIQRNIRARSAVMRVAERLAA